LVLIVLFFSTKVPLPPNCGHAANQLTGGAGEKGTGVRRPVV